MSITKKYYYNILNILNILKYTYIKYQFKYTYIKYISGLYIFLLLINKKRTNPTNPKRYITVHILEKGKNMNQLSSFSSI